MADTIFDIRRRLGLDAAIGGGDIPLPPDAGALAPDVQDRLRGDTNPTVASLNQGNMGINPDIIAYLQGKDKGYGPQQEQAIKGQMASRQNNLILPELISNLGSAISGTGGMAATPAFDKMRQNIAQQTVGEFEKGKAGHEATLNRQLQGANILEGLKVKQEANDPNSETSKSAQRSLKAVLPNIDTEGLSAAQIHQNFPNLSTLALFPQQQAEKVTAREEKAKQFGRKQSETERHNLAIEGMGQQGLNVRVGGQHERLAMNLSKQLQATGLPSTVAAINDVNKNVHGGHAAGFGAENLVPFSMLSDEGRQNRQRAYNLLAQYIRTQSGKQVSDKERAFLEKVMGTNIQSVHASDIEEGLRIITKAADRTLKGAFAGYPQEVGAYYSNASGITPTMLDSYLPEADRVKISYGPSLGQAGGGGTSVSVTSKGATADMSLQEKLLLAKKLLGAP